MCLVAVIGGGAGFLNFSSTSSSRIHPRAASNELRRRRRATSDDPLNLSLLHSCRWHRPKPQAAIRTPALPSTKVLVVRGLLSISTTQPSRGPLIRHHSLRLMETITLKGDRVLRTTERHVYRYYAYPPSYVLGPGGQLMVLTQPYMYPPPVPILIAPPTVVCLVPPPKPKECCCCCCECCCGH